MNETLHSENRALLFPLENFQLFINAVQHGLLIIDAQGTIVFANQVAQTICFREPMMADSVVPLAQALGTEARAIHDFITSAFTYQQDSDRQITYDNKIYLVTSKAVFKDGAFAGCVISFNDVTSTVEQQKQHEMLYQVSSALAMSSTSDLTNVLEIALGQILRSIRVSQATIMLFNRQTNALEVKVASSRSDETTPSRSFKIGEGVAGKCAQDLRPYSEYDVTHAKLFTKRNKQDKGALLAVPIVSRGKLLGVINVSDAQPRYFTENEVQFLTIISNEIAIAIENVHLYSHLQTKISHLLKLFTISVSIGEHNIDTRIQQIISVVPNLLEAEGCYVYIYSSSQEKFILKYRSAVDLPIPSEIPLTDKRSQLLQEVINKEATLTINDVEEYANPQALRKAGIHNFISMPLIVDNKAIGVISTFNKFTGSFTEEDANLLAITESRIATKMENYQLLKSLASEKELLDKTINNISEGVLVLNRRRKVIVWNEHLEEMTGIPAHEALGKPCYKILYDILGLKSITQEIYLPSRMQQTRESRVSSEDEQMRTVSGERMWVSALFSHILNRNRNIENTIIVLRNVSKEREFMQAKNEFVSLATHELRTPLTAIKGYLSMATSDTHSLNATQRKYLTKAAASTDRLVNLVEELLDVVRIDEDRLELVICPFVINDIIEDTLEELGHKAKSKNLRISYRSGPAVFVQADREKTKQILQNLVDNAIKYTKSSGVIQVSLERINNKIVIAVRDNGVGIPKKHLNAIFDRFVRIDNPLSIKAGGTGLGLYIVKNFVQQQGGEIWVNSQVGKGTTFYFSLPLAQSVKTNPGKREENP